MPGTPDYAEIQYTLSDLIVAEYSKTANTYGVVESLANGQTLDVEPENDTDQLRGYGKVSALLSVNIGAKLKLSAGGVDAGAFQIMTGTSNYTSGTTPNRMRRQRFQSGGAGLPYFGAIGVAPTDDGGKVAVGLQACKLNAHPKFSMNGKENKFNMQEIEGYAIPIAISGTDIVMTVRYFETASDWVAPTTAATFLAFFSAA